MGSIGKVSAAREGPETVCMMRNGINDFMDYLTIVVVLFIPIVVGSLVKIHLITNSSSSIIRNGNSNYYLGFMYSRWTVKYPELVFSFIWTKFISLNQLSL